MTSPSIARAGRRVELDVSGMTCAACASRVERTLNRMPDVRADVSFATGRAVVVSGDGVSDSALIATVERSGRPRCPAARTGSRLRERAPCGVGSSSPWCCSSR